MTRLVCFDMDGVLFEHRNFWMELHRSFGTEKEGQILTEKFLHRDYARLVEEVVARLWKGKDARPFFRLVESISYLPGVQAVFQEVKKRGWLTAIISSGSMHLARRAQHDLGVDFIYANDLVIKDGKVSGEFLWPIGSGREKKAEIIKHLCADLGFSLQDVIYVGDDLTDLEAFKLVGRSIAFNSRSSELKKAATYVVEDHDLRKVLPFLG